MTHGFARGSEDSGRPDPDIAVRNGVEMVEGHELVN